MESISPRRKRELRSSAHALKPVVTVGSAGVSDAVLAELEIALETHELLKLKLPGGDRELRQQQIDRLLEATGAALIQTIGHTVTLYRRRVEEAPRAPAATGSRRTESRTRHSRPARRR